MTDIPEAAIDAAMEALKGAKALYGDVWAKRVAVTVLEAAAPHLAAAVTGADVPPLAQEAIPPQAIEDTAKAIARLKCVQAGWASGIPGDGQADWLRTVTLAALEAAAPHLAAAERERCAALIADLRTEIGRLRDEVDRLREHP